MKKYISLFVTKLLFGFNFNRKILKTHLILPKNDMVEKSINDLKDVLEEHLAKKKDQNLFMNYELSLSQYIFKNLINNKFFNIKLIFEKCFFEKFYYPLPLECLKIIEKKGFKVNFFYSKILWYGLIFTSSVLFFFATLIRLFIKQNKSFEDQESTVIYLNAMPNIESNNESSNLQDFYSWFTNFFLEKKKIKNKIIYIHENKAIKDTIKKLNNNTFYEIKYFKNFLFRNFNRYLFIQSVKEAILLISKIGLDKILILDEIIKYNYLLKNKKNHPEYALFNMSNMTFQPLWSKIKNKNDEYIDFMFYYSTNIIPLVENPELVSNVYGYRLHSWKNYIFWNENQKNWVEQCSKKKLNSIIINNYIPFEGKNISVLKNQNKKILIFDVPPRNDLIYFNFMHVNNIYTFEYCSNFFIDVTASIKEVYPKAEIIYKLKRDIKTTNLDYKKLVLEISSKFENFKIFYDEISAQSLINDSDASISIPFTSAALIADYLKKPSIYYHPSNKPLISDFFPKSQNQINNKKNLNLWLKQILL